LIARFRRTAVRVSSAARDMAARARTHATSIGLALVMLGPVHAEPPHRTVEVARQAAIQEELARVRAVVEAAGGWRAWNDRLAPSHADIHARIAAAEAVGREIIAGPAGSLFTTALTRFALAHNAPPEAGGALDIRMASGFTTVLDLSRQLEARGIHVIFVPIPQKEEVDPRSLSGLAPEDVPIYPQRYLYMEALLDAGVEVMDLLPAFQKARQGSEVPLYPDTDLHWGNRAMGIAAREIALRLARYPFARSTSELSYKAEPFRIEEQGPLVKYFLPEEAWGAYPSLIDEGLRVLLPDGRPYAYDAIQQAPVLLIGDSFMMRSRSGGSFAARLAFESGVPVTGHMENQKGAQAAARILARKGPAYLEGRRAVVWYVAGGMLSRAWSTVALPE